MSQLITRMTIDELRHLVESCVEEKLLEILGDPDEGLEVRRALKLKLVKQKKEVARGERGRPLRDVGKQLGLE